MVTPPKFNIAPENGWLEDLFPLWDGLFSGVPLVSFRECNPLARPAWKG